MIFHYLGNERFAFEFLNAHPNLSGAFLVVISLLAMGVFFTLAARRDHWSRIGAGMVAVFIVGCWLLLAFTYSRGSFVALGVALAAATALMRNRWNYIFILLFAFLLLTLPDGASRLQSATDFGEGSIRNRLLIWSGSTGIAARFPLTGVRHAGQYYTSYYQPTWLDENYNSMVSDYFTFACRNGLLAFAGVLLAIAFVLFRGFRVWREGGQNPLLLGALLAAAGSLICGVFTTNYTEDNFIWCFYLTLAITAAFIIGDLVKRKVRWSRRDWLAPLVPSLALPLGIYLFGLAVNAALPYRLEQSTDLTLMKPRSGSARGTVIYPAVELEKEFRPVVRRFAENGYAVAAFEIPAGIPSIKPLAEKIRTWRESGKLAAPLILIGKDQEYSLLAIAAAAELEPDAVAILALVNPPENWPFDELSPPLRLSRSRASLLIVVTIPDAPRDDAYRQWCAASGRKCEIIAASPPGRKSSEGAVLAEHLIRNRETGK